MNYLSLSFILIILLFKKCFANDDKKYILLPFTIQQEKIDISQKYDSSIFIQNNFYRNITFDFYIGNPPKKVNGIILNDNLCFEFKIEKDLYSYNNFFSYINNKYIPNDSSSFSILNKELRWNKGTYYTLGSDIFKFGNEESFNLSFLFNITDKESIDIDGIKSQKYIAKFSFKIFMGHSGDECPNFIEDIKKRARLNKYLISYEFIEDHNGYLIIGDEFYKYKPKIYHESQYITTYTNDKNFPIENMKGIIFDEVNNNNITLNRTETVLYIKYDLGVIIGTNQYKQIIDEIFFNKLISQKICQIETVRLNSSDNYYVYSCKEENLNLKQFPKLLFISKTFSFNLELNYNDLFSKKANDIYYFLILFKANNDNENNDTNIKESWMMGKPFYRKYKFTFNLDAKILGLYNPKYDYDVEEEINSGNNGKENNNNTWKIIIFCILGFVFLALLMFLSFYLGMKIKEGRKKRANELKDDNYEYFPPEAEKEQNQLFN